MKIFKNHSYAHVKSHKVANRHNKTEAQNISVATNYSIRVPASFSSSSHQKKKLPAKYVVWNSFSEEQLHCMLDQPVLLLLASCQCICCLQLKLVNLVFLSLRLHAIKCKPFIVALANASLFILFMGTDIFNVLRAKLNLNIRLIQTAP